MIGSLVAVRNDPCISIDQYISMGIVLRRIYSDEYPWLKEDYKNYYKVYTNRRTTLLLHKEEISVL
jgi:hypothetical protein